MANELAVKQFVPQSFAEIESIGKAMTQSGFFQDAKSTAQAIVKIMAGQELGFGAFASMTGIYIIQGRPSIGANLMAAAVKGSRRYNYRVSEMTDTACEVIFFEDGKEIGRSRFTAEDAKKAGTKNMDRFPKNMLFARAISNGVRWFCPDVFNGSPVYTPEELGADVDQEGNVIPGTFTETPAPKPAAQPAPMAAEAVALGGQVVKSLADRRIEAWTSNRLSADTAAKLQSSDGTPYMSLPIKDLQGRVIGLKKKLADNHMTQEQRDETQEKLDCAQDIIALGID